MACTKCDIPISIENGYFVCRGCGDVHGVYLCATTSAKHHELTPSRGLQLKVPYTRVRRFARLVKRLIGVGPAIKPDIIVYVQKQKPRSYADVMRCIRNYRRDTGQKPVCFSRIPMVYTLVCGKRTPTLSPDEIRLLEIAFRIIERERSKARMVKFPYNYILQRLLRLPHIKKNIGARAENIAQMVKSLSCRHRTALYDRQLHTLLGKNLFAKH